MQEFQFHRPSTLAEAVEALKGADEPKMLAGGQSLIPVLKMELAAPSDVISLAGIPGLSDIRVDNGVVAIGAMCTHAAVAGNAEVQSAIPSLAHLADHIGDAQVRNRGTLGGSVAHADPAADYPAALVALKATIKTDRGSYSADEFFTDLFETQLAEDEIVTAVHFQVPEKAWYSKFANPASKYAVAGVMVAKHADGVRVAVTGAASTVFRITEMEEALNANFSAGAIAGISVSPDNLNSELGFEPDYKAHLVGVMARRAVEAAR